MSPDAPDARWFESSHSSAGSECVEVAHLDSGGVGVHSSTPPDQHWSSLRTSGIRSPLP
ncbi:DUF397 domain-containing protein [Nocardia sp. CA-129566]|uniref:DUF397 domain-containing protein n=1 Tax=Nocardia sp. CA-129566 TaxID=3239976 RepID=UPI003D970496